MVAVAALVAVAHRPVPGDLLVLIPLQAEEPFVPGHWSYCPLLLPPFDREEEVMANCSLDVMWAQ